MGNSTGRAVTGFGVATLGFALAPFTGGASAIAGVTFYTATMVNEVVVSNTGTHTCGYSEHNMSSDRGIWGEKVKYMEIRYCHITGPFWDAMGTWYARASMATTDAAHHHFLLLQLESGKTVYLDKHANINIAIVHNTLGLDQDGRFTMESRSLKQTSASKWGGNVLLQHVWNEACTDKYREYHLLDNNCQKFAKNIYDYFY